MSKVRTAYWGQTPVFAVDYEDGRELREATFFDRREAEAFAAEQAPAAQRTASSDAIQRANNALMDRIASNQPPQRASPRTLGELLKRIRSGRHTTMGVR